MRASEITDILTRLVKERHPEQVVVPECKTGPTQGVSECPRMDAWVMFKSWAHPRVLCYEIKSTRQDFVKDDKWRGYLPYCNEFYFVTAPQVVTDCNEIPPEAGWVLASKNLSRLYTKKKAPYRDVQIPEELWRYILMCRASIESEQDNRTRGRTATVDYWRRWLAEKKERRELGYEVSHAIREHVRDVLHQNTQLQEENKALIRVREWLHELNIRASKWSPDSKEDLARLIRRAQIGVPQEFVWSVAHLAEDLQKLHATMKQLLADTEE